MPIANLVGHRLTVPLPKSPCVDGPVRYSRLPIGFDAPPEEHQTEIDNTRRARQSVRTDK